MIWFMIIWTLATLGFFALASSMSKHQKQIFAKDLLLMFRHTAGKCKKT